MTFTELKRCIREDPALTALETLARERLSDDPGHDLAHAHRVALWTLRLGGEVIDRREAIAAALLHDAVNAPKDSPERLQASESSARLAAEVLPGLGFPTEAVDRICEAIREHSYSRGGVPHGELGRALQDADRLEALGALGVFRTITCGARLGARYADPDDPWARRRSLDDKRYSVDHFFVKLLKLEDSLLTEAGRVEARRRTAFMRAFLTELGEELGEAAPNWP